MNTTNLTVAFCHNIVKNNSYTIAYARNRVENTLQIHLGFSFCSDKDRYEKKLGRKISEGRLQTRPLVVYGLEDKTNNEIIEFAVSLIDKYGKEVLEFNCYDVKHGFLS